MRFSIASLFILSIFFAIFFVPSIVVQAADVNYGRVLDYTNTSLLIGFSGLKENSDRTYTCPIETLACTEVATTTTAIPPPLVGKSFLINPKKDRALISSPRSQNLMEHTLVSVTGSELKTIATLPITEPIRRVLWSDNGSPFILITSSGYPVRYDPADNTFEYLERLPTGAGSLTLSPNGRYVAYYIPSTQTKGQRTYGIIDTLKNTGYEKTENVAYWDLLSEGIKFFAFSPDSTRLLYLGDTHGPQTLYQVNLASLSDNFKSSRIISKNYTVSDFMWINNSSIVFTANRESPLLWSLYTYNITTGNLVKRADNVSYAGTMKPVGKYVVFTQISGNSSSPALYNTTEGTVSKLLIPGLMVKNATPGEVVKAGSLYGVYAKPTTAVPALSKTLLVWLHGGPFRQAANGYHPYMSYAGYDWMLDEARAGGVSVLKLDYPGSFGYGREFAEKITGSVGSIDVKDSVAAIKQFATARGFKNIYLIGNSYGGYLSLKTIVDQPTLFAGAFSINGVTDWGLLNERLETSIFNVQFKGLPGDSNKSLYSTASIFNNIGKIGQQKIILVHGEADTTIPVEQSQILNEELATKGKNVEFITYADENHVFEKQETFESLCSTVLRFVGASAVSRCSLQ